MRHSKNIHFLLLFFILPLQHSAGQDDSSKTYVVFTKQIKQGELSTSLGLSITVLPRIILEEGVLQLPMLEIRSRYGILDNIFLLGHANFVYLANQVSLGIGVTFLCDNVSFSIADKFNYWFGFAKFQGFDATAMGLTNSPVISAGFDLVNLHISMSFEALLSISQHTYFGNASVGIVDLEFVGYAGSFTVEEELWKNNYFLFGIRFQYSLPLYQTWLAFSASNRWALFPEFYIGYQL